MERFSIKDIEILTGIKAHTLRIWEQRFSFFKAERKESKQRIYSNEDLKKLLCISFLYHNGRKISAIAALTDEEIRQAVRDTPLRTDNFQTYVQQLLEAAIDFNEAAFLSILNRVIATVGLEQTMLNICYPCLHRIGLLWDTGNIIPAQEHFASYLIQNRLISETELYSAQQSAAPEIVLYCPENEFHELPLLFLNYLLRKNRWNVMYLGKNVKLAELAEAAGVEGVKAIYLHTITNFTGFHIDDYLETLRKTFPDKIIFASGGGIVGSERNFVGVQLLRSDEEIYKLVNRTLPGS